MTFGGYNEIREQCGVDTIARDDRKEVLSESCDRVIKLEIRLYVQSN